MTTFAAMTTPLETTYTSVLDEHSRQFYEEAMRQSGGNFPMEYLQTTIRRLAAKDLELQDRERRVFQMLKQVPAPYVPRESRGRPYYHSQGERGQDQRRGRGRGQDRQGQGQDRQGQGHDQRQVRGQDQRREYSGNYERRGHYERRGRNGPRGYGPLRHQDPTTHEETERSTESPRPVENLTESPVIENIENDQQQFIPRNVEDGEYTN